MGEMQVLFDTEKNQRSHRQNHLQALHSLLVETQWFLAPLGSGTVAKMANLHKNSQRNAISLSVRSD
jgi:hypothetical protein